MMWDSAENQVRVSADKSGVELASVKMSMNPFCEAPRGFAAARPANPEDAPSPPTGWKTAFRRWAESSRAFCWPPYPPISAFADVGTIAAFSDPYRGGGQVVRGGTGPSTRLRSRVLSKS